MICSKCSAEMPDNAVFCASCGSKTESLAAVCTQCQTPLKPGAKFCPACGKSTGSNAAPSTVTCPQCAAAVAPGLSFCPKCGTRLAAGAAPVYQQQYAPPPQYAPAYQAQAYPAPAKRKSKGPLIAIASVLVVLLGIGAYAMLVPNNPIKNALLGPKGTYVAVEANALKTNTADLVSDLAKYGNKSNNEKGGFEVELKVILEDGLGIDASQAAVYEGIALKNRLLFDRSGETTRVYNRLGLLASDEELMSIDAVYADENLLIGMPGILDKYISATAEELQSMMASNGVDTSMITPYSGMIGSAGNIDLDIDENALKGTFAKMVDIMLANIDTTEKTTGQALTAGGVTAKYDLYTMTVKKESARKMVVEILKMLQNDKAAYDFYTSISDIAASSGGMPVLTMEEYKEELQTAIDDVSDTDNDTGDFNITQLVYVDGSGEVVGRDLTIVDEYDTTLMSFQFAHPVDGSEEAVYYSLDTGSGAMEFTSSYTVSDGKQTGTASLSNAGSEIMTIDFSDLIKQNVGTMEDVQLGKFVVTLSEAGSSMTAGMPSEFVLELSADQNTLVIDLSVTGMAGINLRYTKIEAGDVKIPDLSGEPTVSVTDQQALSELMTPDVQQKFMDIAAQLGIPLGSSY